MGHRKFTDIVGEIDDERRARIDAIKEEARADAVAFNLAELRRHRALTQVELAERLQRAQASISAMETADDNLLSTWRSVIEGMGGRLELVAVSMTNVSPSQPPSVLSGLDNHRSSAAPDEGVDLSSIAAFVV